MLRSPRGGCSIPDDGMPRRSPKYLHRAFRIDFSKNLYRHVAPILVSEGFDEKVKRPVVAKFAQGNQLVVASFDGSQNVIAIKRFKILVKIEV